MAIGKATLAFTVPHQLLIEPVFQGLVREVGLPQQPSVDGVLVEELLADCGLLPIGMSFRWVSF